METTDPEATKKFQLSTDMMSKVLVEWQDFVGALKV
jgi:hypothetical protein